MLLIWCYCVRPTHPIHLTLVDFPSARILLSLDLLISNFKLCLVMKHDDRWVPITTQSLEFGVSPSEWRNLDQWEVFHSWSYRPLVLLDIGLVSGCWVVSCCFLSKFVLHYHAHINDSTEHGGQTTTMFHFSPLKQIGLRKSWLCHQESWIFLYFVNTKSGSFSCNVVSPCTGLARRKWEKFNPISGFQCRNHHHASCSRKSTLVMVAWIYATCSSWNYLHESMPR